MSLVKKLTSGLVIIILFAGCDGYSLENNNSTSPSPASFQNYETSVSHTKRQNQTTPIRTYINTDGNEIQSPTYYSSQPVGASAKCRDNTYSFSQHRRGTCSGHDGVARWL